MSPIADMLIQLKNAQARERESILIPASEIKFKIAEILKSTGLIEEIERKKKKTKKAELPYLMLKLKYNDGVGAIVGSKMISKPSRRMYLGASEIKPVRSGFGILVISTSQGIMTGEEAKKKKIGGEPLFEIW